MPKTAKRDEFVANNGTPLHVEQGFNEPDPRLSPQNYDHKLLKKIQQRTERQIRLEWAQQSVKRQPIDKVSENKKVGLDDPEILPGTWEMKKIGSKGEIYASFDSKQCFWKDFGQLSGTSVKIRLGAHALEIHDILPVKLETVKLFWPQAPIHFSKDGWSW